MVAEQRPEQLVRARRRERIDRQGGEAGSVRPVVFELGPAGDEEEQTRGREPVEERAEERLRLDIDPLEIFENQHEGLPRALLHDHLRERIDHAISPLARVEHAERVVRWQRVEQRQDRRARVAELGIEVAEGRRHLLGHA